MVSAPLSPLSDHLHLLPSNATRLWSCVHTGLQHMPETDGVQNMSHLKVPIKTELKVMKQLFNVVKVPRRPSWAEWTDFWKHTAMYPNDAQVQLSFSQGALLEICTNYSNSSLIITLAALVVILFLRCILFLPVFNTHQWQCLLCRCAARHERACRSRSVLRTSAASLSALSGIEPHYLGNTKHMALRQTGPWQSACAKKLPKLQWTCEKQTCLTVDLLFFLFFFY